MQLKHMDGPDF